MLYFYSYKTKCWHRDVYKSGAPFGYEIVEKPDCKNLIKFKNDKYKFTNMLVKTLYFDKDDVKFYSRKKEFALVSYSHDGCHTTMRINIPKSKIFKETLEFLSTLSPSISSLVGYIDTSISLVKYDDESVKNSAKRQLLETFEKDELILYLLNGHNEEFKEFIIESISKQ